MTDMNPGGVERFPMATWLRCVMIAASVIMMAGIVTIPICLYRIWRCFKAEAVVSAEGLAASWMGLRGWSLPWAEISGVRARDARGALAAALQPLEVSTTSGNKRMLPVGGFRDSQRILQLMHERGVPGIVSSAAADGSVQFGAAGRNAAAA